MFFREIFYGIVQGLTEFLPISSSGHLVLSGYVFHFPPLTLLEVTAYHVGTLVAVLWIFRDPFKTLFFPRIQKEKIIALGITTFCTGSLGLLLSKLIGETLEKPFNVGLFLIGTGVIITGAHLLPGTGRLKNPLPPQPLTYGKAVVIGVVQAFAAFPGISRSGTTLAASFWCRLDRREAVEYSFLASIPVIFGAFVKEVLGADPEQFQAESIPWVSLTVGFVVSALSGVFALKWFVGFLRQKSMIPFAIYCALIGLGSVLVFYKGE
jgi:undecaprenyl-diphosphatase